jgi:hypothetical protein
MNMGENFDLGNLRLLNDVEEIEIETETAQEERDRRILWVVVVGSKPYVRSANGQKGHWYHELIAKSAGAVYADGHRIPFQAVPVSDAETLTKVSEAYMRKYAHYPDDVAWLVSPAVLPTTLRLEPV